MKIKELKEGQKAIITNVGEDKETCRLCSMGFSIGQTIILLKTGRNLIVKLDNVRYGIESKCLDCIEVEIIDDNY